MIDLALIEVDALIAQGWELGAAINQAAAEFGVDARLLWAANREAA